MMRKLLIVISVLATMGLLLIPSGAQAFDVFGGACSNAASTTLCQQSSSTTDPLTGPNGLLLTIANVIALIAGASAVIVIIISGLRFVTSGGDPSKAQGARSSLIAAIVGLVIIALAYTIISFVLSRI